MTNNSCLIVGVDYGTTFSGISYASSDATTLDHVHLLVGWGNSNGSGYGFDKQVPSRISYGPPITWGYGIRDRTTAYCWTKLLLDKHTKLETEFDDGVLQEFEGPGLLKLPDGKSAQDVVADYLHELYESMMEQLERRISREILAITPIQFWITLPAMWSVRADEATKRAAMKAGFGSRKGDSIHLIREPEAAAIASLRLLKEANHPSHSLFQTGSGVLICDCGGGTVDLASYEIESVQPRLSLRQACVSKGGKCGSTSIDRAFYKLMCDRFGSAFTKLGPSRTGQNSDFMKKFEAAKRSYSPTNPDMTHRFTLRMKVEDSDFYDKEWDEVLMTTKELRSLFDPTIQKIINLLEQQVKATLEESQLNIKLILLVGGFGDSPYLYFSIQKWCIRQGITLIAPDKSWEAICLGATLRGLEGSVVTEKKSRFHIGVQVAYVFKPGIDTEKSAFINQFTKKKMAGGYAWWIVNRGEMVTPGMTKQTRTFWVPVCASESKRWTETIFQSEDVAAPNKTGHSAVTKLGELEVDLTDVDWSKFETRLVDNHSSSSKEKVYKVEYVYELVLDDDMGHMYFRTVCHGKQIGQTRLKFGNDEGM